jgi:hypothetical protein
MFQQGDERRVFGDVVRANADETVEREDARPFLVHYENSDARLAWIAARGAVGIGAVCHAEGATVTAISSEMMMRPQCSQK